MKKLMFVYNPKAGKGKIRGTMADIVETFDKAGYQVVVRPTHRKGDTVRIMNRYAEDFDRIVISGGDGTLSEALQGLRLAVECGKEIPDLGFIPTGSTNDFATSLGIPSDPIAAAKIAAYGDPFPCDAGTFNGHPFAYIAAFGAFTEVSYATPQQFKNTLGHLAYLLEGLKAIPQIKGTPFTVEADGETLHGKYLYGMVSNSISVGGFTGIYAENHVALNDGLLEVLLIKEPKSIPNQSELMTDILRVNLKSPHIVVFQTKKVTFTSDSQVPWTLDGEFGGKPNAVEIESLPRAYRIIIPPKESLPSGEK